MNKLVLKQINPIKYNFSWIHYFSGGNNFIDDLVSRVDINKTSREKTILTHFPQKLLKGLSLPQETKLPDKKLVGSVDSLSVDIEYILTKCLQSRFCQGLFGNVSDNSFVIEIDTVKVNKDSSHLYVFWKSDILHDFASLLSDRQDLLSAKKFYEMAAIKITKKLQQRESTFRYQLASHVSFRRCPRIYFRHNSNQYVNELNGFEPKQTVGKKRTRFLNVKEPKL
jgi:ribosome-binding factor A